MFKFKGHIFTQLNINKEQILNLRAILIQKQIEVLTKLII